MRVIALTVLAILVVFITSCYIGDKTIPIVGDIADMAQERGVEENEIIEELKEEGGVKENETIGELTEEGKEEVEKMEGIEEEEERLSPGTHLITIKDLRLNPQELIIKKGDTVIWKHEDTWESGMRHYLASHTNEFRGPTLYYGDTFNYTFNEAGTVTYIDVLYKEREFMRGKIVVE